MEEHKLQMKKLTKKERRLRFGVIMGTCLTLAIMIVVALSTPVHRRAAAEHPMPEGCGWADTLTNAVSHLEALEPMDRDIERFMRQWGVQGMQLAVVRGDSLVYTKGYGWADREEGVEMEATSIMRIASASKLVTAIAAMKLIEEGRLSLDSKVFGPKGVLCDTALTSAIADKRALDMTVDHLLLHEGGFSRWMGDPMFRTSDMIKFLHLPAAPTSEELVKIVMSHRLAHAPGAGRRYSNFGYMLLSLVIERAAGMDYWDYVLTHVLEPVGACGFRPAGNYYADRHDAEVRYYAPDSAELVEEYNGSGSMVSRVYGGNDIHGLMGAGGWVASAADLARLVAATDGLPQVADILSAESIGLLTETGDKTERRARGWVSADPHGNWVRTGTLASTHTYIKRFANGDIWVLLTNTGVWTGHTFSHRQASLVNNLASRYDSLFPHRSLW